MAAKLQSTWRCSWCGTGWKGRCKSVSATFVPKKGRINCERVLVIPLRFMETENGECVTWMLQKFKKFTTTHEGVMQTPKLLACDGTYCIITPVRNIFPTLKIILDEWHVNQKILSHALAYTNKRDCVQTLDEMKSDIRVLLASRPVPYSYNPRRAFEIKYLGSSQLLTMESSFARSGDSTGS